MKSAPYNLHLQLPFCEKTWSSEMNIGPSLKHLRTNLSRPLTESGIIDDSRCNFSLFLRLTYQLKYQILLHIDQIFQCRYKINKSEIIQRLLKNDAHFSENLHWQKLSMQLLVINSGACLYYRYQMWHLKYQTQVPTSWWLKLFENTNSKVHPKY